jgi:DNA-directed RNA polymerase specialized sigma54-like protein
MNNISLREFLQDQLSYYSYELNSDALADDLAYALETRGYCSSPYFEHDKALMCQINKRHEPDCRNVHCASYNFCMMMRKEGYV